ncbi:unnamed protein product [Amoebophrya sp. A25]|nr:unnamed protein product [Amoebophrya sp. A25]|eukprot:GSA25T00014704001.1
MGRHGSTNQRRLKRAEKASLMASFFFRSLLAPEGAIRTASAVRLLKKQHQSTRQQLLHHLQSSLRMDETTEGDEDMKTTLKAKFKESLKAMRQDPRGPGMKVAKLVDIQFTVEEMARMQQWQKQIPAKGTWPEMCQKQAEEGSLFLSSSPEAMMTVILPKINQDVGTSEFTTLFPPSNPFAKEFLCYDEQIRHLVSEGAYCFVWILGIVPRDELEAVPNPNSDDQELAKSIHSAIQAKVRPLLDKMLLAFQKTLLEDTSFLLPPGESRVHQNTGGSSMQDELSEKGKRLLEKIPLWTSGYSFRLEFRHRPKESQWHTDASLGEPSANNKLELDVYDGPRFLVPLFGASTKFLANQYGTSYSLSSGDEDEKICSMCKRLTKDLGEESVTPGHLVEERQGEGPRMLTSSSVLAAREQAWSANLKVAAAESCREDMEDNSQTIPQGKGLLMMTRHWGCLHRGPTQEEIQNASPDGVPMARLLFATALNPKPVEKYNEFVKNENARIQEAP